MKNELSQGRGRTRLKLNAFTLGTDLIVVIQNQNAHLGAVAVGEYDAKEQRASTSVFTRSGHRDDAIAVKAAHTISKATESPVCVIAGIHLDDITGPEIKTILANADKLVVEFLHSVET